MQQLQKGQEIEKEFSLGIVEVVFPIENEENHTFGVNKVTSYNESCPEEHKQKIC